MVTMMSAKCALRLGRIRHCARMKTAAPKLPRIWAHQVQTLSCKRSGHVLIPHFTI